MSANEQKKAKEPAVASAEKFMAAIIENTMNEFSQTLLDPAILFNCPMGLTYSRPHVKRWIAFESSLMQESKIPIVYYGTWSADDGMKIAHNKWSIAGLFFTDTIVLNPVLMVKGVMRTMERRPKPGKETELTNHLLLQWTGPYFAKYCGPKKGLNNRALVLPVLDYSYKGLVEPRELRMMKPSDAKEITDSRIALHFLQDSTVLEEEDSKDAAAVEGSGSNGMSNLAGIHQHNKDEITIRARNRDGDQAAIVIDRSALGKDGEDSAGKMEGWEDSEVIAKEQGLRFVASGVKLCKNNLTDPKDLDRALKITVINAFYFLNWVDLSSNQITRVPDLSQYPIVVLYMHDNKIKSMDSVQNLQGLSMLQNLTLFGNPIQSDCTNPKKYKFGVLNTVWEGFKTRNSAQYTENWTNEFLSKKEKEKLAREKAAAGGGYGRPTSPAKTTRNVGAADMPLKSFDHSVLTKEDRQCLERYSVIQSKKETG